MTTSPKATLLEFLTTKFEGAEGHLSVWLKRASATKTFATSELAAAAAYIEKAAATDDAYVAISTQIAPLPREKRGDAETVCDLTGLFADVDFGVREGGRSDYPSDQVEALAILDSFSLKLTWIVGSGNGLHLHFDFERPFHVASDAGRERAKRLSAAFQRDIGEHFRAHGRRIDSVGDIVRCCRPPGTLNHKNSPPTPVDVVRCNPERRITVEQIEALVEERTDRRSEGTTPGRGRLADHAKVVEGCRWYREVVVEGADSCSEPDWFAAASIAAACEDGERIFLDYSSRHPEFKERESREKFRRAVKHGKPRSCKSVADDLGHRDICAACPKRGSVKTPLQLGRHGGDAGREGPIALGYSADGNFVLLDRQRQIIIVASSSQLLSLQYLLGLMPLQFWARVFPGKKKGAAVDAWAAGQALMEACRKSGPFDPRKVRGRGVWREGDRVVLNFGDPAPEDLRQTYICFEPLPLNKVTSFDVARLLRFLERFSWRSPQDPTLLLGWLAIAPICGVLNWRPHCFLYGPPNCGKTTTHTTVSALLRPLGVSADGQSSEAGIRQLIKADSRPCIIDEFESDQSRSNIAGVIRLARSASSSESPVLRGTPEGKAMQFMLRTCFFFAAVNPSGIGPADATRILLFEMLKHSNDPEIAAQIAEDEVYFADMGPRWCGYMAGIVQLIPLAIETFKKALPGIDSRHRQNVATLLAGAFVALNRSAPTEEQAGKMADAFKPSVEAHAEAFERDDAMDCLQHLLGHIDEKNTLGYWLAAALRDKRGELKNAPHVKRDATRVLRNFDLAIRLDGKQPGFFIKNRSPAIESVYLETKWGRGAWEKALRKLDGYFAPRDPVHFAGSRDKARAVGLPLDLLPEVEIDEEGGFF